VVDRASLAGRLTTCSALERVWILALLGRCNEAVEEGQALLAGSTNRLYPLLVLAHVFQSQYRRHEAARLHEEALRLARTPIREATVRHQIGKRLFEEGKYRDAAAEFEWARDLFRSYGHRHSRTQASEHAMHRARELAAGPTPEQQHIQTMATERRKPPTMHEAGISILDTDRYPSGTTTHQHVAGTTL
jgi:Tfp pilus assembly protein PilF